MNLIKIINEEIILLLERTYNISDQVNLLYDAYFKNDIIKINKGIYESIFKQKYSSSAIFTSNFLKEAHKKNPIKILINDTTVSNGYDYTNKILYLGINKGALELVKDYSDIETAVNKTGYSQLFNEFTEVKVKSSIRHELTHWLDDTYTDLFNKRKLFKGDNLIKYRKNNYEYVDKFEINSIIGNILELKRYTNINKWNQITFEEMLDLLPQLNVIKNTIKNKYPTKYSKWKKNILSRMYRENLLGDNMMNT